MEEILTKWSCLTYNRTLVAIDMFFSLFMQVSLDSGELVERSDKYCKSGWPIRSDIRAVTDGKYKFIWNLTPENLYSINITTCDLTGEVRETDFGRIYPSMIDRMETDPHAKEMVNRLRSRPQHQLYDLQNDPYELNNLAEKPEYSEKVTKFKADIEGWMKQQGDDGHLDPEGMRAINVADYEFPYPPKGSKKSAK